MGERLSTFAPVFLAVARLFISLCRAKARGTFTKASHINFENMTSDSEPQPTLDGWLWLMLVGKLSRDIFPLVWTFVSRSVGAKDTNEFPNQHQHQVARKEKNSATVGKTKDSQRPPNESKGRKVDSLGRCHVFSLSKPLVNARHELEEAYYVCVGHWPRAGAPQT